MPNDLVQPAHLLDISNFDGSQRANPTFDTSNPNWPSKVVGGHTFDGSKAYKFEWVSILNPNEEQDDEVGVTGTVLKPELSGADLPFTHPFGSDFEFTIVPDPAYEGLLARANKDPNGVYARSWTAAARTAGIAIPTGVLGLEIDAALVPPDYRPAHGDRVAVYGRWIVDAGHPEFHTEIHAPLLMARARTIDSSGNPVTPSASATTFFQVWSRPYQAGQLFATGGDTGLPLRVYAERIAETLGDVQAFPPVFATPFQGIHLVLFTIRPPVPAQQTTTARMPPLPTVPTVQLQCSYHFTVNGSCGVEVIPFPSPAEPNCVHVILALNSASYPTLPEPPYQFDQYSILGLLHQAPSGVDLSWLETAFLALQGNVGVRRFAAPHMSQTQDSVNVVPFTPLTALPRSSKATDDTQPFPVYGWVKLKWVDVTQREV